MPGKPSNADQSASFCRSSKTSLRNSSMPRFAIKKLNPRPGAIALLTQTREHARDRLRCRQKLFFRQKFIEQLRLVRHRAETAADVKREAALYFAVDDSWSWRWRPCHAWSPGRRDSARNRRRRLSPCGRNPGYRDGPSRTSSKLWHKASCRRFPRGRFPPAGRPSRCAPRCRTLRGVVIPTAASRRISAGVSSICT